MVIVVAVSLLFRKAIPHSYGRHKSKSVFVSSIFSQPNEKRNRKCLAYHEMRGKNDNFALIIPNTSETTQQKIYKQNMPAHASANFH